MPELVRPLKSFDEEYKEIDELTQTSIAFEDFLKTAVSLNDIINNTSKNFLDLIKHYHKCHKHYYTHDVKLTKDSCNNSEVNKTFSIRNKNPKIDNLMLEFFAKQDLTSNGSIFGIDYYFDSTSCKNSYVSSVNSSVRFFNNQDIPKIKWKKYVSYVMKSLKNCDLEFNPNGDYEDHVIPEVDFATSDDIQQFIENNDINSLSYIFISENKSGYDLDNNDLVYGYDFYIPDINSINKFLFDHTYSSAVALSYESYLKSVKKESIIMYNIPNILEPELINILNQEFNTGIDVDNDGYIYGKDIIIYDSPSNVIKDIPYLPTTIISWNAFKICYDNYLSKTKPRTIEYYLNLLKEEYLQNKDLDYNNLIYNIDFIIDEYYLFSQLNTIDINENCLKMSLENYLNTLPFKIYDSTSDTDVVCVRLAHEFSNIENLIDTDNNGFINCLDFIISDCDSRKSESLSSLEKNFLFSTYRDNLSYIKQIFFTELNTINIDYTQEEFNQYWFSKSGVMDPELQDSVQNEYGCKIVNNQIVSVCYPIWSKKTNRFPLFIPILSLYDYDNLNNTETFTLSVSFNGEGVVNSIPEGLIYKNNSQIVTRKGFRIILNAISKKGYQFDYWNGLKSYDIVHDSTSNSCYLLMLENRNIVANFIVKQVKLRILKYNGDAIVKCYAHSITCGLGCAVDEYKEYTFDYGTNVKLDVEQVTYRYNLKGWKNVDYSTGNSANIILYEDRDVIIEFERYFNLSVFVENDSNASVDIFIKGALQNHEEVYILPENTIIDILVTLANNNYKITYWDGVDYYLDNSANLILTKDVTVQVHTEIKKYYLFVMPIGGSGIVDDITFNKLYHCYQNCVAEYESGTTLQLQFTPDVQYKIIGWTGVNSFNNNIADVSITSNKQVYINLTVRKLNLTINKIDPFVDFSISHIECQEVGIYCDKNNCNYTISYGTALNLISYVQEDYAVKEWKVNDLSYKKVNKISFFITEDTNVDVTIGKIIHVTFNIEGVGEIIVNGIHITDSQVLEFLDEDILQLQSLNTQNSYKFYSWSINSNKYYDYNLEYTLGTGDVEITCSFIEVVDAFIFYTYQQFNNLLNENFNILSLLEMYNTWNVFGHGSDTLYESTYKYFYGPASQICDSNPSKIPVSTWIYNYDKNSIYQPTGRIKTMDGTSFSSLYSKCSSGFISQESRSKFNLETVLCSDSLDDSCSIGVILAFNNDILNPESQQDFLAVIAYAGKFGLDHNQSINVHIAVVKMINSIGDLYNSIIIQSRTFSDQPNIQSWGQRGKIRFNITRKNKEFIIKFTKWNNINQYETDPIIINLETDQRLSEFNTDSSRFGLMSFCQDKTYYENFILNYSTQEYPKYVYILDESQAYEYIDNSWNVSQTSIGQYYGQPKYLYSDLIDKLFLLDNNQITEVVQ